MATMKMLYLLHTQGRGYDVHVPNISHKNLNLQTSHLEATIKIIVVYKWDVGQISKLEM